MESLYLPDGIQFIGQILNTWTGLREVRLPETLVTIGPYFMRENLHIRKFVLPASVRYIGPCAFASSLVEEVVLPHGLFEIDQLVFSNCTLLRTLEVPSTVARIGACFAVGCILLESVVLAVKTEELGINFLAGCRRLKKCDISGCGPMILFNGFLSGCIALEELNVNENQTLAMCGDPRCLFGNPKRDALMPEWFGDVSFDMKIFYNRELQFNTMFELPYSIRTYNRGASLEASMLTPTYLKVLEPMIRYHATQQPMTIAEFTALAKSMMSNISGAYDTLMKIVAQKLFVYLNMVDGTIDPCWYTCMYGTLLRLSERDVFPMEHAVQPMLPENSAMFDELIAPVEHLL